MNDQPLLGIRWQDIFVVEHVPARVENRGKENLKCIGPHEATMIARPDQVAKALAYLAQDQRFDNCLGFYVNLTRLVIPSPESRRNTLWFRLSDGESTPLSVPEDVVLLAYDAWKKRFKDGKSS